MSTDDLHGGAGIWNHAAGKWVNLTPETIQRVMGVNDPKAFDADRKELERK